MSEKQWVFAGEDCHSQCLKIKIKNGGFETKVGFWGILERRGCMQWDVWESGDKREEREGGELATRESPVFFPASAFWTAACWMIGLKSLLIWPLCLFFDKTHLALPFKLGHTIHNMHLVKRGLASPHSIQIKLGRVHFEFSKRSPNSFESVFFFMPGRKKCHHTFSYSK